MELDALVPVALGMWAVHDKDGFDDVKAQLRQWAKRDPIDALLTTVVGGGVAFWIAERDTNPHCKTAWDGILYMSTSLSVGYDNLFPTTPVGHALATFAQTFGPAMANAALEEPGPSTEEQILAKLEEIATLLAARA